MSDASALLNEMLSFLLKLGNSKPKRSAMRSLLHLRAEDNQPAVRSATLGWIRSLFPYFCCSSQVSRAEPENRGLCVGTGLQLSTSSGSSSLWHDALQRVQAAVGFA